MNKQKFIVEIDSPKFFTISPLLVKHALEQFDELIMQNIKVKQIE